MKGYFIKHYYDFISFSLGSSNKLETQCKRHAPTRLKSYKFFFEYTNYNYS